MSLSKTLVARLTMPTMVAKWAMPVLQTLLKVELGVKTHRKFANQPLTPLSYTFTTSSLLRRPAQLQDLQGCCVWSAEPAGCQPGLEGGGVTQSFSPRLGTWQVHADFVE